MTKSAKDTLLCPRFLAAVSGDGTPRETAAVGDGGSSARVFDGRRFGLGISCEALFVAVCWARDGNGDGGRRERFLATGSNSTVGGALPGRWGMAGMSGAGIVIGPLAVLASGPVDWLSSTISVSRGTVLAMLTVLADIAGFCGRVGRSIGGCRC